MGKSQIMAIVFKISNCDFPQKKYTLNKTNYQYNVCNSKEDISECFR